MTTMSLNDEFIQRVDEFLNKHLGDFTPEESEYIRKNATWGVTQQFVDSLMRQVYDEVGLLDNDKNIYYAFADLLANEFDINQHIIEIGGGHLPKLAEHIALRQKSGTITVYDPKLIRTSSDIPNLILKKEKFAKDTPVTDKTLIIGFMPCCATNLIIETADKHNIDFMIALCEGGNREGYGFLESDDEWIGQVRYDAKKVIRKNGMGILEEHSLEKYGDPFPVIYNKKKNS